MKHHNSPGDDTSTQRAQSDTEWTDWHWSDSRIVRTDKRNLARIEECSDRAYLESELITLSEIRQDYLERASRSQPASAKELMRGVSDKDRQIAWVKAKLESLRSPSSEEQPVLAKCVSVEIVQTDELTEDEQRDRLHLERKVERAFYEAGKALKELRDRRLYRSTHKTFEEYCLDRFGMKRAHSYRLIDAALVVENLSAKCPPLGDNLLEAPTENQMSPIGRQKSLRDDWVTSGRQILPTSERQVRPLTKLEPEQQRSVWQQAVSSAGGKVPSGRIVKDIVQRIRERTPVPNPYRVAEVCQLIAQDNPELRGKGGCWCIVSEVHDFGCTVTTWVGTYTVRLEHLKSLDYTESECQKMREISARLTRLHETGNLDAAAYWILNGLGKLPKPYLTPIEEKLLGVLESEYGLKSKPESANEQGIRPDSFQKKDAPASVEVNTNDILIAFASNLDYFSPAQLKEVGKALARQSPERVSEVVEAYGISSEKQAIEIVKAYVLVYPEAIRDLIEEINKDKNPKVNDGNPENGDVG